MEHDDEEDDDKKQNKTEKEDEEQKYDEKRNDYEDNGVIYLSFQLHIRVVQNPTH